MPYNFLKDISVTSRCPTSLQIVPKHCSHGTQERQNEVPDKGGPQSVFSFAWQEEETTESERIQWSPVLILCTWPPNTELGKLFTLLTPLLPLSTLPLGATTFEARRGWQTKGQAEPILIGSEFLWTSRRKESMLQKF
jgi:hypothetical protein